MYCLFFTVYFILPLVGTSCIEHAEEKEIYRNDMRCSSCNFTMTHPKKVINPYRNKLKNHVPYKPFSSICLKCGICIAVAKQMEEIFQEVINGHENTKQSQAIDSITEKLKNLCTNGFQNYDLRKFDQYHLISDDFKCSSHVHTKEDGKWAEKVRQACFMFLPYIDVLYLFHDYKNKSNGSIIKYMCKDHGIFRDCTNLDFTNTTMTTKDEINFTKFPNLCDNT